MDKPRVLGVVRYWVAAALLWALAGQAGAVPAGADTALKSKEMAGETAAKRALAAGQTLTLPQGLFFTENKGQWPAALQYKADLPGGGKLFLEAGKLHFFLLDNGKLKNVHDHSKDGSGLKLPGHYYVVEMLGADSTVLPRPQNEQPWRTNYLLGSDSRQWAQGARHFAGVVYPNLYPGVDMRVYASEQKVLKYDLLLQPGADVRKVRMRYTGLGSLRLQDGKLAIRTKAGTVTEEIPLSYQLEGQLPRNVNCKFKLYGNNTIGFELPENYDPNQPLVIDPQLIFSTFTGSFSDNWGFTATYDVEGSLYGGGLVNDLVFAVNPGARRFPITPGAFQATWGGGNTNNTDLGFGPFYASDIALIKFDAAGNLVWATYLGGNNNEQPHSLVVNNALELYVLGTSRSTNYPTTPSAFSRNNAGGVDIVVTRLSADGTRLLGSTYVGGNGNDGVNERGTGINPTNPLYRFYSDDARGEIVLDAQNNAVIASSTVSTNFPTVGAFQAVRAGAQDACVFKLRADMGQLLWSSYLGGTNIDAAYSCKLTRGGDVYVGGGTTSADFPVSPGTWLSTYQGGSADGFVVVIRGDGGANLRGTFVGTTAYDQINVIQTDAQDNVYFAGQTAGNYPILNAAYNVPNGGQFITKLAPSLVGPPAYSTRFGSNVPDNIPEISITAFLVDFCEHLYVSGWGGASLGLGSIAGLPVTPDAFKSNTTTGNSLYLTVLFRNSASLFYASYFGGDGPGAEHVDGGTSRFDPSGVVYQAVCAGCQGTSLFPTTPGAYSTRNNSPNCNLAIFKFDMQLTLQVTAGVAQSSTTSCINAPITFQNRSRRGVNYTWNFGDGTPVISTTQTTPVTHTFTAPGNYVVSLVANNPSACNVNDTARITIAADPVPTAGFNLAGGVGSGGLTFCGSRTVTFNNTTNTPGSFLYQWSFGDGNTSTAQSPTYTYAAFQPYTVQMRAVSANGTCTNTFRQTIRLGNAIPPNFNVQFDTCSRRFVLTNTTAGTAVLQWDLGNGQVVRNQPVVTGTYAAAGTYTISLQTNPDSVCAGTRTFTLNVPVKPAAAFSFDNTVCNLTVAYANASTNATSYQWDLGDGTTSTVPSPTRVYAAPAVYPVRLIARGTRCPDTLRQNVPAYLLATASFAQPGLPNPTCGGPIQFNNTTVNGTTYLWRFGNGDTSTVFSPRYRYPRGGFYNVSMKVNYGSANCADSALRRIFVPPTVQATYTADNTRCDRSVTFTSTDTSATFFSWTYGDGSTPGTARNPTHRYANTGNYSVTLRTANLRFTSHPDSSCYSTANFTVWAGLQTRAAINVLNPSCDLDISFASNSTNATTLLWRLGDGSPPSNLGQF
jgi:PKD repeat protein